MKNIFKLCSVGLMMSLFNSAQALDFQTLGSLGYENLNSTGPSFGGVRINLFAEAKVFEFGSIAGAGFGTGFNFFRVTRTVNGADDIFSAFSLPLEAFIEIKPHPIVKLVSALSYDIGLSGSFDHTINASTISNKIKNYGRFNNEWRVLFAVTPKMEVGTAVNWFHGSSKQENDATNADYIFQGNDFNAVFIYHIYP